MSFFDTIADPFKNTLAIWILIVLVLFFFILTVALGNELRISQGKAHLDNRPRWMLGNMRDDTGSTNPTSVFGRGYGLEQSVNGAQTIDDSMNFALGRSTKNLAGLHQSEYGETMDMKAELMTPRPVLPLMQVKPKENLDQKEKVSNKTTEDNLKKFLYQ